MNRTLLHSASLAGLTWMGLWAASTWGAPAEASSHREAPFVTENPKVDATDFYAFRSFEPGKSDRTVLIANYAPLQDPDSGPNFTTMDPTARYEIKVDNDGDALEDFTFRFQFKDSLRGVSLPIGAPGQEKNVAVPLRFVGPVSAPGDANSNIVETYGVAMITQGGQQIDRLRDAATGSPQFEKPVDNVGSKTIPNYDTYASQFIYDFALPGGGQGRVFVGQRADPFVVNLGEVFDLVNLDPVGPLDNKPNELADKSVTTLALELPTDFLTQPGQPVLGAWTTAWLPRTRTLRDDPTFEVPAQEAGDFLQVSRLGMPLVNELVIGLPDKNRFNASRPFDDGQFLDYVEKPALPKILELLFGVQAPDFYPRADLTATFLTGFVGLNANGSVGEMLRLNTAIPPTPRASQLEYGALVGDLAGFPNGRRVGDDVVDITLRIAMGVFLDLAVAPGGQLPFNDGVLSDPTDFPETFPFLNAPLPGAP